MALSAALVSMVAAASGCRAGQSRWATHYVYSYAAGANAAGTGVVVDYDLVLAPSKCVFTAEGYQTDDTIRCTARATGDKVDIAFKSYGDGTTKDARGASEYSVGETLFSLERRGGSVLTHWRGYPAPDDKPHPPEVDFVVAR